MPNPDLRPPIKAKLLIVDDDESLGRMLLAILKKAGYDALWTAKGKEALDFVQSHGDLDIILIDIKLPDVNGLDVLRGAKKIRPDIGALMMTGFADTQTAVEALNQGAFAYIQKPYQIDEVKAALDRLIEKQKLVRENKALLEKMLVLNEELEKRVEQRTEELQASNINLLETVERLRQADAYKTRFVSMVSHELRTPLTAIIGFTETILERMAALGEEKTEHYLKIVHEEAKRLARLIEDILGLARYQNKEFALEYKPINLKAMAEKTVEKLKILNESLRFEIRFKDDACHATADPGCLEQILVNLVGNAIKYSPQGGAIRIEASLSNGDIEISVSDSGPGINEKDQEKVFQAFYRTQDAVNAKSPGTGLGLTITKAIVETLGGRIWLDNASGQGAKFIFTIPKDPREKIK